MKKLGAGCREQALPSGGSTGREQHSGQWTGVGRRRGYGSRQTAESRHRSAFSLIELLVAITVIAILATISVMTMGYVNRKSALSRTQAEIATIAAALDSYKLDYGGFPASDNLYTELTGQGPVNTNKIYLEPTPLMVTNRNFVDPFGVPYNYTATPTRNLGFFDLWSVPPPPEGDPGNPATWIHN